MVTTGGVYSGHGQTGWPVPRAFFIIGVIFTAWFFLCSTPPAESRGIIDNFDNDYDTSDGSGQDGKWVIGSGNYQLGFADSPTYYSQSSLKVYYNKGADNWTFIELQNLNATGNVGTNFSSDTFITARIYGAVSILTKFRDDDGTESDIQTSTATDTYGWSRMTWRFGNAGLPAGLDLSKIKDILFFVMPGTAGVSGTFYMDNLRLGYGPDTVSNLIAVPGPDSGEVTLSWNAIGDAYGESRAKSYQLRMSSSNITAANFSTLSDIAGVPTPSYAGAVDSIVLSGLDAGDVYFFALKVIRPEGDTSNLSNVACTAVMSAMSGVLLLEDFDDGKYIPNGWGGTGGYWAGSGATIFPATASSDESLGKKGGALKLTYNRGTGECGFWTSLTDTDLSGYKGVSFWVRGASGGEDMLVGLKTSVNSGESKIKARPYLKRTTITTDWQKISIPFNAFDELDPSENSNTSGLTRMNNLSFTFNTSMQSATGTVYIDDIVFLRTITHYYIEDFDGAVDATVGTNASGGRHGTLGDGTLTEENGWIKITSVAGNDDGVYITFMDWGDDVSKGDQPLNVADADVIEFYARGANGGETLEVNLEDRANRTSAVSVSRVLGMPLPAAWTKIAVPLDVFAGVDMTNLNALHFRLGVAGMTAYIDSVLFADSSLPATPTGLMLNGSAAVANAAITSRNILSVTASSGADDIGMQEVRFEYSTDAGGSWNTISVDRDLSNSTYEAIWVARNITGAPSIHENPHDPVKDARLPAIVFPYRAAGGVSSVSFRAVAVDVAGNTSAIAAVASSSITATPAVVYPNPYYPMLGGTMKFTNLAIGTKVKIYTLAGELIRHLDDSNQDGQIEWDGTNTKGSKVASGLYFYTVVGGTVNTRGKLVVIK